MHKNKKGIEPLKSELAAQVYCLVYFTMLNLMSLHVIHEKALKEE
jgi:hypothetical protein